MKNICNIGIISSIIFIFSACQDSGYKMLTTINEDGTCAREFTELADSAFMVGDTAKSNPFPFPIDTTFEISWTYDSLKSNSVWPLEKWEKNNKKKKVTIIAKKLFSSVVDMAGFDYLERGDWKSLRPYVSYNRKFRWFYTYHRFSETFPRIKTFDRVSINKYLTEEEVKMWFQGHNFCFEGMNGIEISEHLSQIEKKINQWIDRNVYEEHIHAIVNNIELLDAPGIDAKKLLAEKDSIYKSCKKKEKDIDFDIKVLDNYFNTNAFTDMFEKHKRLEHEIDSALSFFDFYGNQLEYRLVMPGKIINTNSATKNSDTLSWKVDAYRFSMHDYEMYANSRTPNIWAFIVSAIIIIMVVLLFLVPVRKI
jgi:hypothetical protein